MTIARISPIGTTAHQNTKQARRDTLRFFRFQLVGGRPLFLYRIMEGLPVTRAAIRHDDRAALAYVCDIRDEARQNNRADENASGFASGFSFDSHPLFTLVSKKS